MTALRIIFMGTAELSCASLQALAGNPQFQIAAVVTPPDRPKGRDLKPQPSPVKSLALKLGLPVFQPECARDGKFIAEFRSLQPDLVVVVAYGQILPPAILDLPRHGCLNIHTSLLPKYRGPAPIQWAIANADTETGVTLMRIDAGLDTGDIVAQRRTPIRPEDDSATLHDRLAQLGAELLAQTIPDYVAGKIQPKAQPAEGASYAAKIKKEDGRIDWNQPGRTIWNRLRAFTPWPGAFTFLPGQPKPHLLKIWKAEVIEEVSGRDSALRCPDAAARHPHLGQKPGEILSADKNGIVVTCGRDALRILELQREGGRRLTTAEFLAGHPMKVGESFLV
ncbi:MAG: methionyl-tRNA formyltransferase [Verrucomicrobiota bacterium]|jgi:methionyl-tRNA formyltransferase